MVIELGFTLDNIGLTLSYASWQLPLKAAPQEFLPIRAGPCCSSGWIPNDPLVSEGVLKANKARSEVVPSIMLIRKSRHNCTLNIVNRAVVNGMRAQRP